jgi:universal stress protein A
MHVYQHILCAVDFSSLSEAACQRALALAEQSGARLTFLHVVEYFPGERSNQLIPPEDVDPAAYEAIEERARLAELAARLACEAAHQQVLISPHSAWREIVRFAGATGTDLIVLGSHGFHGVATLLGSSANALANRAPCDVLTVRHRP